MITPSVKPSLNREERRVRREARREKQRAANIGRAAKMHDARLIWEVNYQPIPISAIPASQQYYVGCSGWFYWHWRNVFYPADLPTGKWFEYYSAHFNTVELNAPFYSWPTVDTVHRWIRQAGRRRFSYTVKASELITHIKRFRGTKTLIKDFGHIADLLAKRMGCFLFQFPPSFDYTPSRLRGILSQLDPVRRNVVEFRHRSWWNEKVFSAFRSSGTIFCSCSGPRLPDELVITTDDIYIRFHGIRQWYRHNYTSEELAVWTRRIRASGARNVYAYFNNDRDGYAIKNARSLLRMLRNSS
jgi:uncharacterized protein YecE (DUF72 family)